MFILGLNSDTVLTLSPRSVPHRTGQLPISESSYTDQDLDILSKDRALLHITGAARYSWNHGIRLGVVSAVEGLSDFFGRSDNLVPRQEERFSIVFAFA